MNRAFRFLTIALALAACTAPQTVPPVPPLQAEIVPRPPVSDVVLIWRPGDWEWTGGGYVWRPGAYEPAGAHSNKWLPGHWEGTGTSYSWMPGHWL